MKWFKKKIDNKKDKSKKNKMPKGIEEKQKLAKIIFGVILGIFTYLVYVFGFVLLLENMGGRLGRYIIKQLGVKIVFGDLFIGSVKDIIVNGRKVNVKNVELVRQIRYINWGVFCVWTLIALIFLALLLKKKKKLTIHGSARWGEFKDLGFTSEATSSFETSLLNDEGVVLGRMNGVTLRDNAKTHILVSAPTRTGKGVSIIIPTLIDTWKESAVVLDIKGENYQKTSGARKELFDNRIIRFAPKSHHSSKFNPMAEIRFLTEYEYEDIKLICKMLCQSDSDAAGKDTYWDDKAADLLAGVMTYELYVKFLKDPKYIEKDGKKTPISSANLTDVLDFFRDPNYTESVHEVLKTKAQSENMFDFAKDNETKEFVKKKLLELHSADTNLVLAGKHPNVAKTFVDFGNTATQTFGSILSNATDKLNIFGIDIVKKNTSSSDFRINDIMNYEKPVTLYLVVEPSAIVLMSPLIRILLVQMINLLTPEMDYNNTSKNHKHRCLLLLDEFPAIGKMDVLEKGIGYVAGYGMKVMIILQSLDQLYKIYKKENMFLSNCQVQVFYTANDTSTAEYVSKSLGKETIENYTKGKGGGIKWHSQQQQFLGRELLTADEVRTFPLDKILLLIAGKPPFKVDKIRYFKEPLYLNRSNIPYVYSESCYDKTRQYYKNTTNLYPELKYVPYKDALKGLVSLWKENYNNLVKDKESGKINAKNIDKYKSDLKSLLSVREKLKKYQELIKILSPQMNHDQQLKDEMKAEMKKKEKILNSFKSYDDMVITKDDSEQKVEDNRAISEIDMNNFLEQYDKNIDNDNNSDDNDTGDDMPNDNNLLDDMG